jgi:predicted amidohydrolase
MGRSDITVNSAALQFKADKGKPIENVERAIHLLEKSLNENTDIIVLPEMCTTGYIWDGPGSVSPYAEKADGQSFAMFSKFCEKNKCYLAYGFPERDAGSLYNSQNIIGPDGSLLFTYRKTHLYDMDFTWALPGDTGFAVIDTPLGRLGTGICMDLNYDDFVEYHILAGTDIILFSTNWLDEGSEVHPYWDMRLSGYGGSVIMANTWGYEEETLFCGGSAVYSRGRFLSVGPHQGDAVISVRI